MSGAAILAYCYKTYGLRYKLSVIPFSAVAGHILYVSYTPTPAHDPNPRVTFGGVFPFYGQELSLTEILSPIGQTSQVLQYTAQPLTPAMGTEQTKFPVQVYIPSAPSEPATISPSNDKLTSFGGVGFPDNCEIRIRSLNIYCTY